MTTARIRKTTAPVGTRRGCPPTRMSSGHGDVECEDRPDERVRATEEREKPERPMGSGPPYGPPDPVTSEVNTVSGNLRAKAPTSTAMTCLFRTLMRSPSRAACGGALQLRIEDGREPGAVADAGAVVPLRIEDRQPEQHAWLAPALARQIVGREAGVAVLGPAEGARARAGSSRRRLRGPPGSPRPRRSTHPAVRRSS